ncbi:MAG: Rrf2 family transcriptional regulator [Saprospiraceae bacterium]|nr:Rrf2 family transcriptional regulator [Saprospiraceae bacterium]
MRAVLYMASAQSNETVGVEKLSEKLEIPRHFLAKILQQLSRHHLISSSKGRKGGFYLSKENANKSLISVIECIEGPQVFKECVLGLDNCSNDKPCPYHHVVKKFRDRFYRLIQNETIAESAERIKALDLKLMNIEE